GWDASATRVPSPGIQSIRLPSTRFACSAAATSEEIGGVLRNSTPLADSTGTVRICPPAASEVTLAAPYTSPASRKFFTTGTVGSGTGPGPGAGPGPAGLSLPSPPPQATSAAVASATGSLCHLNRTISMLSPFCSEGIRWLQACLRGAAAVA